MDTVNCMVKVIHSLVDDLITSSMMQCSSHFFFSEEHLVIPKTFHNTAGCGLKSLVLVSSRIMMLFYVHDCQVMFLRNSLFTNSDPLKHVVIAML